MALQCPEGQVVCKYCGLQYPSTEGRWHRELFECRHCGSTVKQMYRNLGGLPEDFKQMSGDETKKFFADLAQQRAELGKDKHCTWSTVRASLVTTMAEKRTSTFKQELEGKFLPLSVWEKQGFCTEVVKKCPKEENPILGDLYCVPVKSISWTETVEKVRQTLLEHERQATAKRQAKSKSKAAQEDLDLPAPAPSNKEDKTQEQKDKELAQEAKKSRRENAKLNALAAKSLGVLTTLHTSFEKLLNKFTGDKDSSLLFSSLLVSSLSLSLPSFRVTGLGLDLKPQHILTIN